MKNGNCDWFKLFGMDWKLSRSLALTEEHRVGVIVKNLLTKVLYLVKNKNI
jgi:hypothetical protein